MRREDIMDYPRRRQMADIRFLLSRDMDLMAWTGDEDPLINPLVLLLSLKVCAAAAEWPAVRSLLRTLLRHCMLLTCELLLLQLPSPVAASFDRRSLLCAHAHCCCCYRCCWHLHPG